MERLKIYWLVALVAAVVVAGFALVAAVVVAGFGIGTVGAADHLSVIKQRGEIIVGTSADYPPYESVDKKGNFVGFDMDIIREVGKRMGLKVKIKDMGFDTLIAALQKKKIDLIIAAMQGTPERDEKVDFSIPYNFVKDAFITSTKADVKMTKALDAAGKKIGVQTGTIQETWVMNNLVKPGLTREDQLFRYERVDNAGLDLAAGRIDLALPEGETSLKAELDRIITQLKKEGWIKRKKAQWGID
ncbi:MAG: amino acid ABC transporter substrate-binding protein [Deltaproteobacteria bacterium]|nr:amino acid ABC transporter substrate-binding protein [Deltaproteobacteria bacterium]